MFTTSSKGRILQIMPNLLALHHQNQVNILISEDWKYVLCKEYYLYVCTTFKINFNATEHYRSFHGLQVLEIMTGQL